MEFRVTVTITEHGCDPDNGLRFLAGFRSTHAETGPVVDQDTSTGELAVTFSFEAHDLMDAMNVWPPIFIDGANASGLPATELSDYRLAAEIIPLSDKPKRARKARKLQPA